MKLSFTCKTCRKNIAGLTFHSQVVTCLHCGSSARVSVKRHQDSWSVSIINLEPSEVARAHFDELGNGAAARPLTNHTRKTTNER